MADYSIELWEKVVKDYEAPIMELANKFVAKLRSEGYQVDEPIVLDGDDYMVSIRVRYPFHVKEGDADVFFDLEIRDSVAFEGEDYPFGVNFAFSAIQMGGRLLADFSPRNYTEACWVDATDETAVRERWDVFTQHLSPADVLQILTEYEE